MRLNEARKVVDPMLEIMELYRVRDMTIATGKAYSHAPAEAMTPTQKTVFEACKAVVMSWNEMLNQCSQASRLQRHNDDVTDAADKLLWAVTQYRAAWGKLYDLSKRLRQPELKAQVDKLTAHMPPNKAEAYQMMVLAGTADQAYRILLNTDDELFKLLKFMWKLTRGERHRGQEIARTIIQRGEEIAIKDDDIQKIAKLFPRGDMPPAMERVHGAASKVIKAMIKARGDYADLGMHYERDFGVYARTRDEWIRWFNAASPIWRRFSAAAVKLSPLLIQLSQASVPDSPPSTLRTLANTYADLRHDAQRFGEALPEIAANLDRFFDTSPGEIVVDSTTSNDMHDRWRAVHDSVNPRSALVYAVGKLESAKRFLDMLPHVFGAFELYANAGEIHRREVGQVGTWKLHVSTPVRLRMLKRLEGDTKFEKTEEASTAYFIEVAKYCWKAMRDFGFPPRLLAGPITLDFSRFDDRPDYAGLYVRTGGVNSQPPDMVIIDANYVNRRQPPRQSDAAWTFIHEVAHRLYFRGLTPEGRRTWRAFIANLGNRLSPKEIDELDRVIDALEHKKSVSGVPQEMQALGYSIWNYWKDMIKNFPAFIRSRNFTRMLPTSYASVDPEEAWPEVVADVVIRHEHEHRIRPSDELVVAVIRDAAASLHEGRHGGDMTMHLDEARRVLESAEVIDAS